MRILCRQQFYSDAFFVNACRITYSRRLRTGLLIKPGKFITARFSRCLLQKLFCFLQPVLLYVQGSQTIIRLIMSIIILQHIMVDSEIISRPLQVFLRFS